MEALFSWLSCKDDAAAPTRAPEPAPEPKTAPEPAPEPTPEPTPEPAPDPACAPSGLAALTSLVESTLGRRDAAAVARRMAADCPYGSGGARTMLDAVYQACRAGGVVAGSAALYLEMVRGTITAGESAVGWWPGDIDCWVDRPADGVRVLDVLVPHSARRIRAVHRHESVVYRGEWPAARPMDNPNHPGARSPYASEICEVELAFGTNVQVIAQNIGDLSNADCGCAVRHQVCNVCLRHAAGLSTRYSDSWPRGRPDARFDLDVPAVRVVQAADGRLAMLRTDGVPTRPRINIRARALWELDEHDQPQPIGETRLRQLESRLQKYALRGWTDVAMPASVVVNGQRLATPPSFWVRLGATADARAEILGGRAPVDYVTI